MKQVEISFNMGNVATVIQTIEILSTDTPKEFTEKLTEGDYVTSISSDGKVISLPNFVEVGKVTQQSFEHDLFYDEFTEIM